MHSVTGEAVPNDKKFTTVKFGNESQCGSFYGRCLHAYTQHPHEIKIKKMGLSILKRENRVEIKGMIRGTEEKHYE